MRSMTESEASRDFAAMLDEVAGGETVLLTRDGKPVARVTPEQPTTAERLADLLERYPPNPEFGEHLERVVREIRESAGGPREWLWDDK
jgi:prevent-host-death family protein